MYRFSGAGVVRDVYCEVCRVQCATCQRWRFISWNRIWQIQILSLRETLKKLIAWCIWGCSTNTSVLVLQKWLVCKKKIEAFFWDKKGCDIHTFTTCPTYLCICAQKPQPRPWVSDARQQCSPPPQWPLSYRRTTHVTYSATWVSTPKACNLDQTISLDVYQCCYLSGANLDQ